MQLESKGREIFIDTTTFLNKWVCPQLQLTVHVAVDNTRQRLETTTRLARARSTHPKPWKLF
eukprot:SAG31_NODE_25330_length_463_cov_1.137363_1_plen_61_part_01